MGSRKNPKEADHRRLARQELEKSEQALERAQRHMAEREYGRAMTTGVLAATIASVAVAEAQHAGEPTVAREAGLVLRGAGDVILEAGEALGNAALGSDGLGCRRARLNPANPPKGSFPGTTPLFLIRTYSSSLLTGSDEIYLVINTEGEVMDAVVTRSEDFGPVEEDGYGNLAILELDVSGAQHRKLKRLAKRLAEVLQTRPTFRPGSARSGRQRTGREMMWSPGGRSMTAANPLKRKLMR